MEKIKEDMSMEEMMEDIDNSMKNIREGQIIKGKVISFSDKEVLVNIGYMADGIIKAGENISLEDMNIKDIHEGDEIYVYIVKLNDGEGNVILSKKMADEIMKWKELEENFQKQSIFKVKVSEVVKGGVVCYIDGIRAFIPASHISARYVKDLKEFLGKELEVKVIEINKRNNKLVLSAKEVEQAKINTQKEKLLKSLKAGEKRKGKVSKLVKFGAFIDLGGVEGLIHLNDLSWKRVNNPADVLNVGDEVEVFVLDVDKEKQRISLALKDIKDDPWNKLTSGYSVGDVIKGKVVKLLDFGAFVEIIDGVEGLVHITEITNENIAKPSDALKIGDIVKVKILELDLKNKRIALSIKEADDTMQKELEKYNDDSEGISLGELLKEQLKNLNIK